MFKLNQRILTFARLFGLGFCLPGLLLLVGCSKGFLGRSPHMERTWVCDEEADKALQQKDYWGSILLHQQFLDKEPNNALSFYHLGYAYGQTEDHLKEASCYEKAIARGFEGEDIFFNLGMAYGELNEPKKSVQAFKKALDRDPHDADNHFGLALAYQRNSNDKRAEEEFLKTIEIAPEHLNARLYLSMLYTDMGDLPKAREQLRKILDIAPSNSVARNFLKNIEKQ